MPLVGIVAKSKEIKSIKKEIRENNTEIIGITKESIKNIRNIKFDAIIILQNIEFDDEEYKYMKEIIFNSQFVILNGDIEINILKKINLEKNIKLITFGFNSKSTITISSVNNEKIIVCLQRDIEKPNGEMLEYQEREIVGQNFKKIYNNLAVFIIKELYF